MFSFSARLGFINSSRTGRCRPGSSLSSKPEPTSVAHVSAQSRKKFNTGREVENLRVSRVREGSLKDSEDEAQKG